MKRRQKTTLLFAVIVSFAVMRGGTTKAQSCNHTDNFSSWERLKAANSAGVTLEFDYVYYRIKRCMQIQKNADRYGYAVQGNSVCHSVAIVQIKAPDGMPYDPSSGEVTAGIFTLEYFSGQPIEMMFSVTGRGQVFENEVVINQTNIKSIKFELMGDVLARLGKGGVRSGTAEKTIVFPSKEGASKTEAPKTDVSKAPTTPSILFQPQNNSAQSNAKISSLSNKMADMDEFDPEAAIETKAPTKPSNVAEFIKAGMWSDMQKQIDTRIYELVPLDDQGNFLLIDKVRIQSEQTDNERIKHFYPGISYPKHLIRRDIKRRYRPAVMGVRG